jgi:hypothetical protein
MSSALAIAAVTAVLKDLLINGLIDRDLVSSVGDVVVTALSPDRIETGADEVSQLNLFMYNAVPNTGWRNVGLPSRDGNGTRTSNPPLALDLSYLVSAYGAKDFHAEILLGYAMQLLHETPVLARAAIRVALSPTPVSGGGGLPPTLEALATSNLADQIEQIKIAPVTMNADEMSRLWTAFGAKYRPSACYRVSVVLIESTLPTRSPLPVLMRGENDRGVVVQPSLDPPFPTLVSATPPNEQTAARLNETVTLKGFHLDGEPGDAIAVLMSHPRFSAPLEIAPLGGGTATELKFQIPNDAANVPAGLYAVSVGFSKAGKLYRTTNELGLALAPNNPILSPASPIARDGDGNVTLTATVSPQVWNGQRASLLLGAREVHANSFSAAKTNTLIFPFKAIPPDDYFVRLRVDGVESILIDRTVTPPVFDPSQKITIT